MARRAMLILWKWDELREKALSHDLVPVKDTPDDVLIRISDDQKDQPDQLIQAIQEVALNQLKNNKETELLLLIHRSALSRAFHPKILPDWPQKKIVPFGGGYNYLYYKYETDTGLVNQTGKLVDGDVFIEHIIKDGRSRPKKRRASILDTDASGNKSIIPRYFDQVWAYYTHECKKLIYEFKEELYIHFAGFRTDVNVPLTELLKGKKDLKRQFNLLCSPYLSEKISVLYQRNSEVIAKFSELTAFLATEKWSPDYLKLARKKFTHVLNAMPEKIY